MRDLVARLPCPVCLGTTMEKISIGSKGTLQIDRCARCGGVWLEEGEVQQLRTVGKGRLFDWVENAPTRFQMRCHDCHAPMARAAEACGICGWDNRLSCPACDRLMQVEEHAGLRLDVCRRCKGVWFDHHELKSIWGPSFDAALQRRSQRTGTKLARSAAIDGDDLLFNALFFAPDLAYLGVHAAGSLVGLGAEAASRLPGVVAATPEVASSVAEAAGEAAGSVFEAIVGIIGGIFDSL